MVVAMTMAVEATVDTWLRMWEEQYFHVNELNYCLIGSCYNTVQEVTLVLPNLFEET